MVTWEHDKSAACHRKAAHFSHDLHSFSNRLPELNIPVQEGEFSETFNFLRALGDYYQAKKDLCMSFEITHQVQSAKREV